MGDPGAKVKLARDSVWIFDEARGRRQWLRSAMDRRWEVFDYRRDVVGLEYPLVAVAEGRVPPDS